MVCEGGCADEPFVFDEPLLVGERKPYTAKEKLDLNEHIVGALVQIVVAPEASAEVDVDSPASIVLQNFGQISGLLWGVTFDISLADQDFGDCALVWFRIGIEIDATPSLPVTRKLVQICGVRIKR